MAKFAGFRIDFMKTSLISAGRNKDKWLKEALQAYEKRLRPYTDFKLYETYQAPDSLPLAGARAKEAEDMRKVLAKLPRKICIIAADPGGIQVDSPAFATLMEEAYQKGGGNLAFLIGGSRGLDPSLLNEADYKLSLSPLTFTHLMTRLILAEQLYRAFKISRGGSYHK